MAEADRRHDPHARPPGRGAGRRRATGGWPASSPTATCGGCSSSAATCAGATTHRRAHGRATQVHRARRAGRGGARLLREHRMDQIRCSTPSGARSACSTCRTCSTCASERRPLPALRATQARPGPCPLRSRTSPLHARRAARARLLALDVDGTLTDGRVIYVGAEELQTFTCTTARASRGCGARASSSPGSPGAAARRPARARELGVALCVCAARQGRGLAAMQGELGIAAADDRDGRRPGRPRLGARAASSRRRGRAPRSAGARPTS